MFELGDEFDLAFEPPLGQGRGVSAFKQNLDGHLPLGVFLYRLNDDPLSAAIDLADNLVAFDDRARRPDAGASRAASRCVVFGEPGCNLAASSLTRWRLPRPRRAVSGLIRLSTDFPKIPNQSLLGFLSSSIALRAGRTYPQMGLEFGHLRWRKFVSVVAFELLFRRASVHRLNPPYRKSRPSVTGYASAFAI